jgi:translation initiation factor 6 (eIF-6)
MKKTVMTMAVVAAITLAATMMSSGTAIMTMMQQAHAQPSNTGSNTGTCSNTGTANGGSTVIQSCAVHQGMCQLAQQSGRDTTGIINNSECS